MKMFKINFLKKLYNAVQKYFNRKFGDNKSQDEYNKYQQFNKKYFNEILTDKEREYYEKNAYDVLVLTPIEYLRYTKFSDDHCNCKNGYDNYPMVDAKCNDSSDNICLELICLKCGQTADITDYDYRKNKK